MSKEKMTACKICGNEVASTAKTCPHCGAKVKRGHIVRNILIVFAVLIVVSVIFGGNEDNDENNYNSHPSSNQSIEQDQVDKKPVKSEPAPKETDDIAYEITYQNSKIYKNSLDKMACYAIVEVENTGNVDLYLRDATFDFEDSTGSLLATCSTISSDPDIIAPGEKGYFYCNMETLTGEIDENTEYVFKPNLKVEKSKNDIIRYDISDLSMTEGSFGTPVEIIGRIANNTDEDAGLVWIAFILYGADGNPLGAFGTNITDLNAGDTVSFEGSAVYLSNSDIDFSDVADYKVYACKLQYQF